MSAAGTKRYPSCAARLSCFLNRSGAMSLAPHSGVPVVLYESTRPELRGRGVPVRTRRERSARSRQRAARQRWPRTFMPACPTIRDIERIGESITSDLDVAKRGASLKPHVSFKRELDGRILMPAPQTLGSLLERRESSSVALLAQDGVPRLSREVLDTVNKIAGQLAAAGTARDHRVAIAVRNGPMAALAFLGAATAASSPAESGVHEERVRILDEGPACRVAAHRRHGARCFGGRLPPWLCGKCG